MKRDDQIRREVHDMGDDGRVFVDRYNTTQRINHWITAALFTLLTLSGLSLFHPTLFWLTNLFGGGPDTRAIHPWFGVCLFASFLILFIRFVALNIPNKDDLRWTSKLGNIVQNKHEGLPELGKYNAGQKMVFWGQSLLIMVMFVTGLIIWDQYFGTYTGIDTKRLALAAHSAAALIAILIIIVHIYAGIWIKGTSRAMIRGNVSGGWAYRHHRKWLRRIALGHEDPRPGEPGSDDDHHPAPAGGAIPRKAAH
jgi:formate dehydrogenase subunit gamma